MAFDFSKIIEEESKKLQEIENNANNKSGYPTLYPFTIGKFDLRLIGNEASNMIYRELHYHEYWSDNKKQKLPCLHKMYGMDCPVCNAVNNAYNLLQDPGIYSKYGIKTRGIMFAKLLNYSPNNYFGDSKNHPNAGDIVLFMFPKSAIKAFSNTITEYADEIASICTDNTSRVVTFQIQPQSNGFNDYSLYVKGKNATICTNEAGEPDNEAFNKLLKDLPDLREVKFPSKPNDNYIAIANTLVEEINRTYLGGISASTATTTPPVNVAPTVNPTPTMQESISNDYNVQAQVSNEQSTIPNNQELNNANNINETVQSTSNETTKTEKPTCFGNNQYDAKCAKCPFTDECI